MVRKNDGPDPVNRAGPCGRPWATSFFGWETPRPSPGWPGLAGPRPETGIRPWAGRGGDWARSGRGRSATAGEGEPGGELGAGEPCDLGRANGRTSVATSQRGRPFGRSVSSSSPTSSARHNQAKQKARKNLAAVAPPSHPSRARSGTEREARPPSAGGAGVSGAGGAPDSNCLWARVGCSPLTPLRRGAGCAAPRLRSVRGSDHARPAPFTRPAVCPMLARASAPSRTWSGCCTSVAPLGPRRTPGRATAQCDGRTMLFDLQPTLDRRPPRTPPARGRTTSTRSTPSPPTRSSGSSTRPATATSRTCSPPSSARRSPPAGRSS